MNAKLYLAAALALWLCVTIPLNAREVETSSALAQSLALPEGSPVHLTGLLVDKVVFCRCFGILVTRSPSVPRDARFRDIEQRVDSAEVAAIAFRDTLDSQFGPSANTADLKTWLLAIQAVEGDDPPENVLDALAAATTIFSNCDIVLATDSTYHERGDGTNITDWVGPEVAALLEAAGCRVFIDFTTYQYGSWYEPLAVNGALEEDLGSFTFPLFTAYALP